MDIGINEVKDMIESLESNGELSIKEEKYLNVAKLCVQLAADNVGLKNRTQQLIDIINNADNAYCMCGDAMKSHTHGGCGHPTGMFDYHYGKWLEHGNETPATDRIYAGIKADGVEMFANTLEGAADICGKSKALEAQENLLDFAEREFDFAKRLREGANHD